MYKAKKSLVLVIDILVHGSQIDAIIGFIIIFSALLANSEILTARSFVITITKHENLWAIEP